MLGLILEQLLNLWPVDYESNFHKYLLNTLSRESQLRSNLDRIFLNNVLRGIFSG